MSRSPNILASIKPLPQAEADRLQREYAETFRMGEVLRALTESGIPPEFLEADPNRLMAHKSWASTYGLALAAAKPGALVVLAGGLGCGKTSMAIQLLKAKIQMGATARYDTAMGFLLKLRDAMRRDSSESPLSVMRSYEDPDFLVLDEVAKRGESAYDDRLLFELLNFRKNYLRTTILTCNCHTSGLSELLGPSIWDRINESGGCIQCAWPSFRGKHE